MTKKIYIYDTVLKNTRDPLRKIRQKHDLINHLTTIRDVARALRKTDSQFDNCWSRPTAKLPKKTVGYKNPNTVQTKPKFSLQTPEEFLDGMLDKLNSAGSDLSPRQCDGTEELSRIFNQYTYGLDEIEFSDNRSGNIQNNFNNLFK
jgi:hypothetical protein